MSGIYIPGMEIPTTCFECPFMFARRYCCADLTLDLYQGDYEELKVRVDGCPLIPVPEHGPLVDALEIINAFPDDFIFTNEQARALTNYIIPADQEKK